MDTDFLYLAVVPAVLAVGLWLAARARSNRHAGLAAAAALALLTIPWVLSPPLALDKQGVVGIFAFILLPVAGALVGWRLGVALGRSWLVLVLAPIGFFLGVIGGVNVWIGFGYAI